MGAEGFASGVGGSWWAVDVPPAMLPPPTRWTVSKLLLVRTVYAQLYKCDLRRFDARCSPIGILGGAGIKRTTPVGLETEGRSEEESGMFEACCECKDVQTLTMRNIPCYAGVD